MHLSLVIPAHNEERRLPGTLDRIRRYLAKASYDAEVVVVENGSSDRTREVARDQAASWPALRVIEEDARGKGLAVRTGMLAARGDWRFMCDADLSVPIEEVERFLPPKIGDAAVAIGSREAPGAVRHDEPGYRHLSGRVFNTLVRWVVPGFQDTQCGFKCFRADAADAVFSRQHLAGFAFDVEILAIARELGYGIAEIPVPWTFEPDTRVSVLRDTLPMVADLVAIAWRRRAGAYRETPVGPGSHV